MGKCLKSKAKQEKETGFKLKRAHLLCLLWLWLKNFQSKTEENKIKQNQNNILIVVIYKNSSYCTHLTQISLQCQ